MRKYTVKYPKLLDTEWLAERVKTCPLRDIAAEVGCSYSAVIYAIRKNTIDHPVQRRARQKEGWIDRIKEGLKKKYPNGRYGPDAANWRGGRSNPNGKFEYILVYAPDHPNACDNHMLEQRVVMEKHLGRYLEPGELVHHINGNKKDNRIENLQLMASKKEHSRAHFDAVKVLQKLKDDPALRAQIESIEKELQEPPVVCVDALVA